MSKISMSGNGYPVVYKDGKVRHVHELVCEAVHGPRPEGMEVLHLDDDPTNNNPTNLRWGTRSENMKMVRGKAKNHKLNHLDVAQIRAFRRVKPYGYAPIMAEKFNVTVQHIRDVAVGKGGLWA